MDWEALNNDITEVTDRLKNTLSSITPLPINSDYVISVSDVPSVQPTRQAFDATMGSIHELQSIAHDLRNAVDKQCPIDDEDAWRHNKDVLMCAKDVVKVVSRDANGYVDLVTWSSESLNLQAELHMSNAMVDGRLLVTSAPVITVPSVVEKIDG